VIHLDDSELKRAMNHMARVFGVAAGGKQLKRELSKQLRQLMNPLVQARRQSVLSLPSKGHSGPSMRQAIARQTRAATRWRGRNTGISIIQRARGMPRDFSMAGRAFNREEGWNPTALGGVQVHQQVTPAKWFDSMERGDRPRVRQAVIEALEDTAAKMADDIRRIR
jgi:hypothetical protein